MRILIAEDDATSRRILEAVLAKWGHEAVVTCDGDEAWRAFQDEDAPRLAVLDWMMPGIDGVEVCRRVRASEEDKEQYTYLILLTGRDAKEDIVAGMEAGADDYIAKPFDQHEMRVRVRAGQRIIELQADLLAAKQDLLEQSRTDPLTGAPNRRAILEQIEAEMSRTKREGTRLSLSMIDIDRFKKVNDTYGHAAGDSVLRECVERASSAVRPYDSLGRVGGEEFLLVLPGADDIGALAIGKRIRAAIGDTDFHVDGTHIRVTVSQGVVTWDGHASVDDVIASADEAMYRAKKNGRDRVELAHDRATRQAPEPEETVRCES